MTLNLKTPKPHQVVAEMKKKGIKVTDLINDTGMSSRTFYRFLSEGGSTQTTIEKITNYINKT